MCNIWQKTKFNFYFHSPSISSRRLPFHLSLLPHLSHCCSFLVWCSLAISDAPSSSIAICSIFHLLVLLLTRFEVSPLPPGTASSFSLWFCLAPSSIETHACEVEPTFEFEKSIFVSLLFQVFHTHSLPVLTWFTTSGLRSLPVSLSCNYFPFFILGFLLNAFFCA